MIKRCIIFDDNDQSEEIEKLIRDGKNQGVEIECEQFNVGSSMFSQFLTKEKIDISKVITEFRKKYNGTTFHFAAFDWDLEDEINGNELIRQLTHNKVLHNTPKIVYSGLLNEILKDILKKGTVDKKVTKIKSLISSDIRGYHERENRDIEIINFFNKNIESLDLIIEEELRKFPNLKFDNKFVREKFNGKTFLEIAEFIEKEDSIRNDFKKEIIQQVIAYLTEKI